MKRNLLLVLVVIIVSMILIYPVGYWANKLIFQQYGDGGFDVGPDQMMVDLFIGGMIIPPLVGPFIFGIWGEKKSKWLLAVILSLPSILFFRWAGIYLLIPLTSFCVGTLLSKISFKHPNPPMILNK